MRDTLRQHRSHTVERAVVDKRHYADLGKVLARPMSAISESPTLLTTTQATWNTAIGDN